jgi:DNA polymerase I-like protein with 3'-5' exonuclease and polymerase domains
MLLQVHDELVFDVHNDELEKIQPMIKRNGKTKTWGSFLLISEWEKKTGWSIRI